MGSDAGPGLEGGERGPRGAGFQKTLALRVVSPAQKGSRSAGAWHTVSSH